jgi:uncharacterized protein (DUF58 family)
VSAETTEDYQKYLDPKVLSRISRLDLKARLIVEGYISGLHKSPFHGFSVEFAQHREYSPGDDLKHLDWKVFAKTDRFYVKQYEEETNLVAHLLLDASESMRYSSTGITKLEYGGFLAACLGYLVLLQTDAVALGVFDREVRTFIPPSTRLEHIHRVLAALEETKAQKKTDVGAIFHQFAERIRRRGVVVVISDLLDNVENVVKGLQHLRFGGQEVIILHVLDPAEIEFSFGGVMRFKGLEETGNIVVEPRRIRDTYLGALNRFLTRIRHACEHNRIDYVLVNTHTPVDVTLTKYLARRMAMVRR